MVEEARAWVGRKFAHQGRTQWGVDCIGLVICVRNELLPWPEGMKSTRTYARNPNGALLPAIQEHCTRIYVPEPGCIALMAWPQQKPEQASHVGFLTPDNIIHAYEAAGKVVETGYRGHWIRWTHSLWRLPGVDG